MRLAWSAGQPHAYEIRRDGTLVATIPMGNTASHVDPDPGRGFFAYTLRATDDPLCPELACTGGGGVPDADGFIREWLVFGPLDWGCTSTPLSSCANPGEDRMRGDYLQGTLVGAGTPTSESSIEPVDGQEIALAPPVSVRATARGDLNPQRPGTGRWFAYASNQSLIDYNLVFGGDPGNDFLVYAVTYVDNATGDDLTVDLGVTSDDAVQVFIGDQEVHINNVARGVDFPGTGAFDVVPGVTLPAGLNRVLVKVFEGGGDTGFALRFEQAGVGIVDGIEVNLAPLIVPPEPVFHRGDADSNGNLELTDAIRILNFLFVGTGVISCADAADADDNGQLQLTDAIRILGFLFLGQTPPATPGPPPEACGPDPGEEHIGCASYTEC
jgi:hypothetical protein